MSLVGAAKSMGERDSFKVRNISEYGERRERRFNEKNDRTFKSRHR